jgi:hypothetical protein
MTFPTSLILAVGDVEMRPGRSPAGTVRHRLAIETTFGEIGTTSRLDLRRDAALILGEGEGEGEVRGGACVRECEGLTKPRSELRASVSG